MMSYTVLVEMINEHDDKNELFWVAGLAKESWLILQNHLDELHYAARLAVEHYMEENGVEVSERGELVDAYWNIENNGS